MVVDPAIAWWVTVPALFVHGLGAGLATAQLTGVVLADVSLANSGQAPSTSRQIGSASGLTAERVLTARLRERLAGRDRQDS